MKSSVLILLLFCQLLCTAQTNLIFTIAGNGTGGNGGDNGPAASASLANPAGMAFDKKGNLYIVVAPGFPKVRKVDTAGTITTFAGTGIPGFSGDSGLAINAQLKYATYVALDSKGNVYISESGNHRIRRVDTAGIITTFAGNGVGAYLGDGGAATAASIYSPYGICFDKYDNLYIADRNNNCVRKVDTNGIINTIAGINLLGYNGDSIPAVTAKLWQPSSVVVDEIGNLYIADRGNSRIRKVDTAGIITTIAGNGGTVFNGDNIPGVSAHVANPYSMALDNANNLFIADADLARVRELNLSTGIITTVAGTGVGGYNGDSILAVNAQIYLPEGLAVDSCGDVYVSEVQNRRVRKIDIAECIPDTVTAIHSVSSLTGIHIYPNPVEEQLKISNVRGHVRYLLINMMSTVVKEGILDESSSKIDFSSFPDGFYYLELVTNKGTREVRKIVKQ